jgi:diguanylate cyclase (GGDEF)-like protein
VNTATALALALILVALVGALAGAAGFAFLVVRPQSRRLVRLMGYLASAQDEASLVGLDAGRIRDARVRSSFEALAGRVALTLVQATVDPLTGIANRQAILRLVDDEIARAARYQRPLSVILADLDQFKRLNDAHGHEAGDIVLRHVGAILAGAVRTADTAGRYGGEEFLVVLPETDADAAADVAEKLRRTVAGSPVRLPDGAEVCVTLSAGVAGGVGRVLHSDILVRDADAALYSAKALGRNQVYVFRETGELDTVRRAPITAGARSHALDVGREAMVAAQAALLDTLSSRPNWAGRPSTLIAEASVTIAQAIALPTGELDRIRTASLLHDLGKLAIPDQILAKPGDLVESEWRVVAEHPKIGQVVLEQAGALRDAATIVLHHHERYDGRGYPHGLAGQEIPVGARIVSIVDAYEAMIAGRPYRAAISHDAAIDELRRQAGAQFDPELVDVFADVFAAGVPWEPDSHEPGPGHVHEHGHDRPHPGTPAVPVMHPATTSGPPPRRGRTTAELDDAVHERPRRVV